ncbi:MAG TPA: creatininase family protein [Candidatus Limnocylindrales bacterium]|nr:creatininase family protein [Candidatus Limnocylindrales bacterium]
MPEQLAPQPVASAVVGPVGAEVRLERLRPGQIRAAMDRAPVAWVPLGSLEYHADHLPNGTDGIAAHGILVAAAQQLGGVVLPWSYVTIGTLALPWSFRYDAELVAETLRQTLRQLPEQGVRLAVVHTGHGPLDLAHLIKRVCAEVEAELPALRTYGLCYLELNAALGTGLGTGWPVAVDHASTMETSWVSAFEPDLVDTAELPDDPAASIVGVYGPNPRFTANAALAATQIGAASELLAARAAAMLRGKPFDTYADLRGFVERYWPEPLALTGRAGEPGDGAGGAAILITNAAPVSRYLSGAQVTLDGREVPADGMTLINPTPGEVGRPQPVAGLGREHGFYVRRQQTAELRLPVAVARGSHRLEIRLELAGVSETRESRSIDFA